MSTPFAQYPFETLQSIGTNLGVIADQINSKSRGAAEVLGFGTDQDTINQALGDFRHEWEVSVKKLGENIGDLGTLSGQIGAMAAGLDAALAQAMSAGARPTGPAHGWRAV